MTTNAPLTLTENAAKQILQSAQQSGENQPAIRLAVEKLDSGKLRYAMGFDDVPASDDIRYQSQGMDIVISRNCVELLQGTTMDFIELDNGEWQFVFLNPLDPNFSSI